MGLLRPRKTGMWQSLQFFSWSVAPKGSRTGLFEAYALSQDGDLHAEIGG